ncbi:hypothetical protein TrispH2_006674 [Trichoplax sp. H2]|nr:hypothetical protein TrispH2_006674 [Trichoplax sp. H2]|eukprot:RDD41448.1 hypothetical protein TrispH2_006674 [Trichoplax sp. H2]
MNFQFDVNGVYAFRGHNGQYVTRYCRNNLQNLEACKPQVDQFCRFKPSARVLPGGQVVYGFMADNNRHWCAVNRNGVVKVECDQGEITPYCFFGIQVGQNFGSYVQVALTSGGRYVSLFTRNEYQYALEVAKDVPDEWCWLQVFRVDRAISMPPQLHQQYDFTFDPNRTYTLKGNNGQFLTRFHRNGMDNVEACKSNPDQFCCFRFSTFHTSDGRKKVAMLADNQKYLTVYNRNGVRKIECCKGELDHFCLFDVQAQSTWGNTARIAFVHDGQYLTLYTREGVQYQWESCKPMADEWCWYTLQWN